MLLIGLPWIDYNNAFLGRRSLNDAKEGFYV